MRLFYVQRHGVIDFPYLFWRPLGTALVAGDLQTAISVLRSHRGKQFAPVVYPYVMSVVREHFILMRPPDNK